jgi:hypothetical protein
MPPSNRAVNIIKISQKEISKYKTRKEGENFQVGDFIFIDSDEYVKVEEGNALLKQKVNKYNIVLYKKS